MTTPTLNRPARYALAALGTAGAASALGAGVAGATPLTDGIDAIAATAASAAETAGIPTPPPAPTLPSPVVPVEGLLPQNLLRTGSRDDADYPDPTAGIPTAPAVATGPSPDQIAGAKARFNDNVASGSIGQAVNKALATAGITADDLADPSAIAQAAGTFTPDQATFQQIGDTLRELGNNVASGQAVRDVQTTVDNVLASPEYAAWRTNTANPFNPSRTGADGIADLIDSASTNPVGTLNQLVTEAGGPIRMATDPVGAFNDVVRGIAGDAFLNDVWSFVNDQLGRDLAESIRQAAPALLLIPALGAAGALLGAPLGALPGSGIGAVLGALNPLAPLVGLLTAIPGSILGGLATGTLGLIGSTLALLPLVGILPLMGAATGSALALAALATVTFGAWLLTLLPALALSSLVGLAVAAVVLIGGVILAGPGIIGFFPAVVSAAILTFLFVTTMLTGLYALLTIGIPVLAFLVLAPLFLLGGATLGGLAGLLAGLAAAGLGIPLLTALSVIPGALAGGILGYLLGDGLTRLVSALTGAAIGGLIGAGIGSLLGALAGTSLGALIGIPLFLALAALAFSDRSSRWNDGPLGRIMDTLNDGWNRSLLHDVLDRAMREWNNTSTGSAVQRLNALVNSLFTAINTLDGRRLRNLLLRGGLAGAIPGALAGAAIGGPLGALAGLLSPLNLLSGLLGGITGALVGAPLGALLGKLLSVGLGTLTALAAPPLLFLPILAGLTALWAAVAIPATLLALASSIIPPIALATAAWLVVSLAVSSPLWIPLTILASLATITTVIAVGISSWAIVLLPFSAAITAAFPPAGALLAALAVAGPIAGVVAGAAGTAATILAALNFAVIAGALLLGLPLVWLPVFLATLPLFVFPALAVPLMFLLSWPLLIPVAAGLSILSGLALGAAVDNLSSLLTVPVGALLGALAGATIGSVAGTSIAALTRAAVYGIVGAGLGGLAGAGIGGVLGAIAALLTSLRGGAGVAGNTIWGDVRIVPNDFLDSLPIPGVGTTRKSVPVTADPYTVAGVTNTSDRELADVSELVAA